MTLKEAVGKVHLYVGLTIGILFFVIAFSGAIYTWAPEISGVIYHQNVTPRSASFISASQAKSVLDIEFPEGDFRTIFYRDSSSTIQVLLYGQGTYYHAEIDPYEGTLVHLQDMNKGWLNYTKHLHRNLMMGNVGREVVHWATLLFLAMLVTGLVIWWPANRTAVKERFTIKKGASRKKLNYDLHNVLGFYITWVSIFSVVTGLFWGFSIVKDALREATGENKMEYDQPVSNTEGINKKNNHWTLIDSLVLTYRKQYPSRFVRASVPHKETDPIHVTVIDPGMASYKTDHLHFDRYTGQQLTGNFENTLQKEVSLFHTLHMMNYDIHFGTIIGLPGRILVFLASLIASSLPVTGFIVWWGKRKRPTNVNK